MYNEYDMQCIPENQIAQMPHMQAGTTSNGKVYLAVKRAQKREDNLHYLKMQLEINREQDLQEYFKEMNQQQVVGPTMPGPRLQEQRPPAYPFPVDSNRPQMHAPNFQPPGQLH